VLCQQAKKTVYRQGKLGNFQHDAAHVLLSEEIFTGELQIVQGSPVKSSREKRDHQPLIPPRRISDILRLPHPALSPRELVRFE